MSWSSQQQRRLGMEKGILEKKLKNMPWFNPTSKGNIRVEWWVNTNNGKGYTLRVYIPNDFPDQCLIMVVSSPSSPLKRKNGSFLNSSSGPNTHSAPTMDWHKCATLIQVNGWAKTLFIRFWWKAAYGWKLMKFIYKLEKILKNICHTCSDYSFEQLKEAILEYFGS